MALGYCLDKHFGNGVTVWNISTVSIANDVACKSLDWLEATFPVLHAPTEQVSFSFSSFKATQNNFTILLRQQNSPGFVPVSPRLLPPPRSRCMRSRMWWALRLMELWTVCSTRPRGWWAGYSRVTARRTGHLWSEPSVWPVWDWTPLWSCQRLWWTECFLPQKTIKVRGVTDAKELEDTFKTCTRLRPPLKISPCWLSRRSSSLVGRFWGGHGQEKLPCATGCTHYQAVQEDLPHGWVQDANCSGVPWVQLKGSVFFFSFKLEISTGCLATSLRWQNFGSTDLLM